MFVYLRTIVDACAYNLHFFTEVEGFCIGNKQYESTLKMLEWFWPHFNGEKKDNKYILQNRGCLTRTSLNLSLFHTAVSFIASI